MTPVILKGFLGRKFGTEPRVLDVRSAGEAIQALCATVPGFELAVRKSKLKFKIKFGKNPLGAPGHLHNPCGHQSISIVPIVGGAKADGVMVLEGIVLLAASYYTGGSTAGEGMGLLSQALFTAGTSMVIGGVSRMLVGAADPTKDTNNSSKLFSSTPNTISQGIAVPCLYGDFYATPPLISQAIDTESFTLLSDYPISSGKGSCGGGGKTSYDADRDWWMGGVSVPFKQ